MASFPWHQHLNLNSDPNWQVKKFTNIFLNLMSNFIPNETKKFIPRDPPWITKPLKTLLNRKNRLFKTYKNIECQQAVESAKLTYLTTLGNKMNDPNMIPPWLGRECWCKNISYPNKLVSKYFISQSGADPEKKLTVDNLKF